MSKQTINIGASPNDGTGTPLRTSFDYTNQNFTELYTALGGGVGLPGATTQVIFNDGGTNLAGDAGLVYNKTTDALTVAGLVTAGSATITGALTVDTTTLVVDATNDRVGFKTASPADIVEVVGSGSTGIRVSRSGALTQYATLSAGATGPTLDASSALSSLSFGIAGTTAVTINSTGNLVLKGGTAGASGVGVTFPAAQIVSSDANCLDDYEEGTWTGTLAGLTTSPTVAVTTTGRYTKIGREVKVSIYFQGVSTVGASGIIRITGLPFTSANDGVGSIGTFSTDLAATFTGYVVAALGGNSTIIEFASSQSNGAGGFATHNAGLNRYVAATLTYNV
jgi:hypothetical protein